MKLLFTNEGLRKRIAIDPDDEPTAGGLPPAVHDAESASVAVMSERNVVQMRIALGTFVRQLRLRDGLSIAQLSVRAQISEDDLRQIEHNPHYTARARQIFMLSSVFNVPLANLSQLSGTTHSVSRPLYNEFIRYAARSDDLSTLSNDERQLLNTIVAVLHERAKA